MERDHLFLEAVLLIHLYTKVGNAMAQVELISRIRITSNCTSRLVFPQFFFSKAHKFIIIIINEDGAYIYYPFICFISVCSERVDDGRPERGVHHRQHAHHAGARSEAQEGQEAVVTPLIIVAFMCIHIDMKSTIIYCIIVNYVLINYSL